MILKMDKSLPETCLADSKINKIVIFTSSLSFILFTYTKARMLMKVSVE